MGGPRNRVHERVMPHELHELDVKIAAAQLPARFQKLAGVRLRSLGRRSRPTFEGAVAHISQPQNVVLELHPPPLSGALCGHHALRHPLQTVSSLILTHLRPRRRVPPHTYFPRSLPNK